MNQQYSQIGGDSQGGVCSRVKSLRVVAAVLGVVALGCIIGLVVVSLQKSSSSSGQSGEQPGPPGPPTPTPPSPALQEFASNLAAALDRQADPCQDFFQYACGGWVASTKMPSDASRYTRSFTKILDLNNVVLEQVLHSEWPLLSQFFHSCLDLDAINAAGASPLQPLLAQIDDATNTTAFPDWADWTEAVFTLLGEWQRSDGFDFFWSSQVGSDPRNPLTNILLLGQSGYTLPRDYYLLDKFAEARQKYRDYVALQFTHAQFDRVAAQRMAQLVLEQETKMAQWAKAPEQMRDPEATYNKMKVKQLKEHFPGVAWTHFFEGADIDTAALDTNVDNPAFFANLSAAFEAQRDDLEPLAESVRAYLRWKIVSYHVSVLSQPFLDASFDFFGKYLSGQDQPSPRNKTCIAASDGTLGELLGRYFVERAFSGSSKDIALDLVNRIEAAFQANLANVEWLDATTREAAQQKLDMVTNMIGYPDKWTDYSSLSLANDDYFGNVAQARQLRVAKRWKALGQPVDRTEWLMTPPTVNAYYEPSANQMVFPAGIIQPTFFHQDYPPAANFGGIGMVMGHELTHGFDDEGSQYDGTGNLTKWWPEAITKAFQQRTQCVVDQYSKFEMFGEHVNGRLTLGENLADNGGIKLAFNAYKQYVQDKGEPESIVQGLTNEQLFFVSFAQGWCEIITEGRAIQQIKTDPHSPARFRIIGPLANLDAFANAFQCKKGTPMNPNNKCYVW